MTEPVLITLDTAPAADSWGFVGRVLIGERDVYQTLRAHPSPDEALAGVQVLLANVLGTLLAAEEWRALADDTGHAPGREDLAFGLTTSLPRPPTNGAHHNGAQRTTDPD